MPKGKRKQLEKRNPMVKELGQLQHYFPGCQYNTHLQQEFPQPTRVSEVSKDLDGVCELPDAVRIPLLSFLPQPCAKISTLQSKNQLLQNPRMLFLFLDLPSGLVLKCAFTNCLPLRYPL